MPNLYIIAGCNGAGKTTASFTILPEVLNCYEFINADSIAAGLSPLNPESMAIEAGRLMLKRIRNLIEEQKDFAFETTLATKSYVTLIRDAKEKGFSVTLLYFWLSSPELAINRVAKRVSQGGHNIPSTIVKRRYYRGIFNFLTLYQNLCDAWMLSDNTELTPKLIASSLEGEIIVTNRNSWDLILNQSKHEG